MHTANVDLNIDFRQDAADQMLSDEAAEPITKPTVSPAADPEQRIQEAKHKCFERMEQESPYEKTGTPIRRLQRKWKRKLDRSFNTNSSTNNLMHKKFVDNFGDMKN